MAKVELRQGDYREVLADVEVDHVISDPPYGARTHDGVKLDGVDEGAVVAEGLGYDAWRFDDVHRFVSFWSDRNRGWFACMTSHDLVPAYEDAYRAAGLYAFAPLPCVMSGMNVRLVGDGPSSWAVWLMVARPKRLSKWGTLPGAYVGSPNRDGYPGGKPEWLMGAIIRDYSRPGELVCDPCAGFGTTLVAAESNHRRGIGAERKPDAFEKAQARLRAPRNLDLFSGAA